MSLLGYVIGVIGAIGVLMKYLGIGHDWQWFARIPNWACIACAAAGVFLAMWNRRTRD
jgi:hypothetical protein